MTPAAERRTKQLTDWLVPALLAGITALLVTGGANIVSIMQAQSSEMQGLRRDFQSMQVQMESRITHLEDYIGKTHPAIDFDNVDFPELAPTLGKRKEKNKLAPIEPIQHIHKD